MSKYIAPKIADMSEDDLLEMAKPVGLPGLPFPMGFVETKKRSRKDSQGKTIEVTTTDMDIGVIESASSPLVVYSPHMSIEAVNRELFTNMPTPSMMTIFRKLLDATRPFEFSDEKDDNGMPKKRSRLMTIFGDPSSGKSFMFKQVGQLVHPEGALMVDCGGMNVRELFWRTVIDYGTGVQEQLNKKIEAGGVKAQSLKLIKDEFPDAVIEKNGKVLINWAALGVPKSDDETSKQAAERAAALLETVYKLEDLTTQSNAFGIKTIPGEILESVWSGRPIVLDEFTKCKIGSDDSMQTFLEFVRGDRDSWTTINSIATTGDDAQKSITLKREDLRAGWFMGVSGNEAKDGHTTHDLSESMMSRLNPQYVTEMTEVDWAHRMSQMLAGFPVSTFIKIHGTKAGADPAGIGKLMRDLTKLGLSANQIKALPSHHEYFLQNFVDTLEAVHKLAKVYFTRQELANPESFIYQTERAKWEKISDEIVAGGETKMRVTTRRFLDDIEEALRNTPEVRDVGSATLQLDLAKVFANFSPESLKGGQPGWYNLGKNLSRVIVEGIINDMRTMPKAREALLALCALEGITAGTGLKEAKKSDQMKYLDDLLKYDPLKSKGLGNSDELMPVRDAVLIALKSVFPDMKIDRDKIPLENIAKSVQAVRKTVAANKKAIMIVNTNIEDVIAEPVTTAIAVPLYRQSDDILKEVFSDASAKLVTKEELLSTLAFADGSSIGEVLNRLGTPDLNDSLDEESRKSSDNEVRNLLSGTSASGYTLTFVEVADNKGDNQFLTILQSSKTNKALIIGDGIISDQLNSTLRRNNVFYVDRSDKSTISVVPTPACPTGQRLKCAETIESIIDTELGLKTAGDEQSKLSYIKSLATAFAAVCSESIKSEQARKCFAISKDGKQQVTLQDNMNLGEVFSLPTESDIYVSAFKRAPRA